MMSFSQTSVTSNWSDAPAFMVGQRNKIINDPIHGHIMLDDLCLSIMDTPQFQRLRDLKQLGSTYYVFPGASHNRFEHSIGTCHLAGTLLGRFRIQQPELEIEDWELQLVRVAGLCHDLGHGPFSHVFDNEFIPRARPGTKWSHEDMSLKLFELLVDENGIDMEKSDIDFVQEVIIGSKRQPHTKRAFLYEIVANGRNSIDVDKFDYLGRDTFNLGIKSSYDFTRLMNFSRVIDDEICYHSKEVYNLYQMYHTRYSLFKQIYSHRAAKGIEYMITDAFLEADIAWDRRLSNSIDDPREFMKMTDCLLKTIEVSDEPELKKARDLIANIRKRKLYKLADEYILPADVSKRVPKVTAADISSCNPMSGVDLRPDDIIIHDMRLNYTNKDKDPVSNVRFFRDWDDTESFNIKPEQVSYLLPRHFEERVIRAYCKVFDDPDKLKATQKAFRAFIRKYKRSASTAASHQSRVWSSPDKRGLMPDSPTAPLTTTVPRRLNGPSSGAGIGAGAGSGGGIASAVTRRNAVFTGPPRNPAKKRSDSGSSNGVDSYFAKRQRTGSGGSQDARAPRT